MTQLGPGGLFANRFEIDRIAGQGGMGAVYRARDRHTGDWVALKLLHAHAEGPDEATRFSREAALLAELRHPGIVSYVAHGRTPDGQRFLAMEWLDGEDLSQKLAQGPLPLGDCIRLVDRVADALAFAHQGGVIHRDLKPSNLLLPGREVERVKILDFGIARRLAASDLVTATGMVLGTPGYMAPEQARGERELSPAADMFSLGCVLYECLTGTPPFSADHIAAVLVRILFEEPTPVEERRPDVPAPLVFLLRRLLAKDPTSRPADGAALRAELATLEGMPAPSHVGPRASTRPRHAAFGQNEQNLFSVVVAALSRDDPAQDSTEVARAPSSEADDRETMARALHALGVSADFLAGGVLVVMVPPTGSATDQASRAARAALLIKERWPTADVSVATGRGAIEGRSAAGDVVERAARSLGPGRAGVALDALSAELLEGRFAQTRTDDGVLLLAEELQHDAGRKLLGKPTPCVGREAELGMLEAELAATFEESEARAVLFTAPPGVGKSRLRHEFERRVDKNPEPVTRLLGRGDLMRAGSPYGILSDAIRRLCDLHGNEPPEEQRRRLAARVGQHVAAAERERVVLFLGEMCGVPFPDEGKPMLRAARREPKIMRSSLRRALLDWLAAECQRAPVLLLLDDLQWGDALTASAIDEALREGVGAPFFVVAFARPEVHEVFPRLWHGRTMREVPLKRLGKRACERLVKHALGEVSPEAMARVLSQAAGNALFLEELIRALAEGKLEEQPQTVVAMLQARIGRLDPGARRVVRAASVFGQTFWRGGVCVVLGLSSASAEVDPWLRALVDAELVEPMENSRLANEKEYVFRHALVRDAARELLTASDLSAGHLLAAEFLEAGGEQDAAAIAEHWERGGDTRRAAACYLRAAESSLDRGDHAGARGLVARGMDSRPEGELLGQLCSVDSYASFWLNRTDRLGEAAAIAMAELRPGSRGHCRAVASAIFAAMDRGEEARVGELLFLLLAADPDADARAVYIEAVSNVASTLAFTSTPGPLLDQIVQKLAANVDQAEPENPTARRYLHDVRAGVALFREPRPWTVVQEWRRAIELAEEAGDSRFALSLRGSIEWGYFDLGDVEGAAMRLFALEGAMTQSQDVVLSSLWRHRLARILCAFPDPQAWRRAEELVAPMFEQPGGLVFLPLLAQAIMARVALLREESDRAEAHARAAMAWFGAIPLWFTPTAAIHIRALLALGRAPEAIQVVEQVFRVTPALGGAGHSEVELRLAASEAFFAAGDIPRAHAELRETWRQVELRAADITDPAWKERYLSRNVYCVRSRELVRAWGVAP